jgi:hypothetical protein
MKTLPNLQILPEAIPVLYLCSGLPTFFVGRTPASFKKPLVYSEPGFQKPLYEATGGFQLARHDSENTFSLISGLLGGFSHS